jgi:hypothetical protein
MPEQITLHEDEETEKRGSQGRGGERGRESVGGEGAGLVGAERVWVGREIKC